MPDREHEPAHRQLLARPVLPLDHDAREGATLDDKVSQLRMKAHVTTAGDDAAADVCDDTA